MCGGTHEQFAQYGPLQMCCCVVDLINGRKVCGGCVEWMEERKERKVGGCLFIGGFQRGAVSRINQGVTALLGARPKQPVFPIHFFLRCNARFPFTFPALIFGGKLAPYCNANVVSQVLRQRGLSSMGRPQRLVAQLEGAADGLVATRHGCTTRDTGAAEPLQPTQQHPLARKESCVIAISA